MESIRRVKESQSDRVTELQCDKVINKIANCERRNALCNICNICAVASSRWKKFVYFYPLKFSNP